MLLLISKHYAASLIQLDTVIMQQKAIYVPVSSNSHMTGDIVGTIFKHCPAWQIREQANQ